MSLRVCSLTLVVATVSITFSLSGCGGAAAGNPATPPTAAFSANPTAIVSGQSAMLQWETTNATSVSIMPDIGTVSSSGSQSVQPTQTTTYTLIASGPGGQASQSVTITVAQPVPPTVTITADPSTIATGQLSTITWSSTNATSITITPSVLGEDQTTLPLSGSAVVSPTATTTYVATATGVGGATATASTTVMLSSMQLNFSLNPSTIAPGQSATLSWSTVGVETLVIDNGVGDVSNQLPNGSVTVTPSVDTTYTATATGPGGTVTQAVAVTVGSAASNGSPIKHIIFMLQENRSFDSYFGQLGPYRASRLQQMGISASPSDVDGIPANVVLTNHHTGAQVSPFHYRTVCTENLSPSWNESHHDVALKGGDSAWPKTTTFTASSFGMKNFLDTTGSVPQKYDPNGTRAMGYYDQTDLPYYYELATQFATSDRWYSP